MSEKNEIVKNSAVTIDEFMLATSNTDINVQEKRDIWSRIINRPCYKKWLKSHPFISGHNYLPIERVRWLLDYFGLEPEVEVKSYQQLANSVAVCVRLHYTDPVTFKRKFQDGVGAVDIQTAKGASAADLASITSGAIMRGLPAAMSFALKNATKNIGIIFYDSADESEMYRGTAHEQAQKRKQEQDELMASVKAIGGDE